MAGHHRSPAIEHAYVLINTAHRPPSSLPRSESIVRYAGYWNRRRQHHRTVKDNCSHTAKATRQISVPQPPSCLKPRKPRTPTGVTQPVGEPLAPAIFRASTSSTESYRSMLPASLTLISLIDQEAVHCSETCLVARSTGWGQPKGVSWISLLRFSRNGQWDAHRAFRSVRPCTAGFEPYLRSIRFQRLSLKILQPLPEEKRTLLQIIPLTFLSSLASPPRMGLKRRNVGLFPFGPARTYWIHPGPTAFNRLLGPPNS